MDQSEKQVVKVLIGISSCLVGHKVRYDGLDQYHQGINTTLKEYQLVPFCPEMAIGLGVPRDKIQLVELDQQIVCLDKKTQQIDYTDLLSSSCDSQIEQLKKLSGYIFKTKSPSCGLSKVKTDYQGLIKADGQGIFAKRLIALFPLMPVIEEDQFDDLAKRSDFMSAVEKYHFNRKS